MKKQNYLTLSIAMLLSMAISAQWSSDPLMNTPLDISAEWQTIPKIALRQSDNGVYVSYFSKASGNYDMMLQRLTHDGFPVWPAPVVVSHNTQDELLFDYSCCTDNDGNCVIAFADIRFGTHDIFAYKISPDGNQLWGENGVRLSHSPEGEYNPALCITSENIAVVSWTETDTLYGDHLIIAAINEDGSLVWGISNIIWIPMEAFNYLMPSLVASDDGDFIVVYSKASGPPWAITRFIYAQRFDMLKNPVWDQESPVSALAGPPAWDNFYIREDGQGGFFIAWYEDREQDQLMESYLQHVDASGNFQFPENGLKFGCMPGCHKLYPKIAGRNEMGELFVYWVQTDYITGVESCWGQRIAPEGDLLWSENGEEIIPAGDFFILRTCDLQDNISYIFYSTVGDNPDDIRIRATSIDNKGNPAWDSEYLSISEVQGQVYFPELSAFADGQWIMVWSDNRDTVVDLYAQNINQDGTIGLPTGVNENSSDLVTVFPNPSEGSFKINQQGFDHCSLADISGRVMFAYEIKEGITYLDDYHLAPGLYFLRLAGPGKIALKKLIIK